jgi:Mor family transcriptional regulator
MDWLKEIEIKDLLEKDAQLIYEFCGHDILAALWKNFPGITIYLSKRSLVAAKQRYIRQFYDGSNIKRLALILDCSECFVYETLRTERKKEDSKKNTGSPTRRIANA